MQPIVAMDDSSKFDHGRTLVEKIFTGRRTRINPENPKLYQVYVHQLYHDYFDINLFVNGTYHQFTHAILESLYAEQIQYIGLEHNTLVIMTYPNNNRRSDYDNSNLGIKNFRFPESYEDISFKSTNSPRLSMDNIDRRKTIYWNPSYKMSKKKENVISFIPSDINGPYIVEASTMHPQYGFLKYKWNIEVVNSKEEK